MVVNDLGGSVDGTGQASEAADGVVREIQAKGGVAVAEYSSVATNKRIGLRALWDFMAGRGVTRRPWGN